MNQPIYKPLLTLEEANRLANLPLKCIQTPLPYRDSVVISNKEDLKMPQELHPAFYGCFDWHSSVHGHWVLIKLMKDFPDLEDTSLIRQMLHENLTPENISKEIAFFSLNEFTTNFERPYGWAWLLKLTEELYTWSEDPDAQTWLKSLSPLTNLIVEKYLEYLPKLTYPIRVGTHTNTAFALCFAWDYAQTTEDTPFKNLIEQRAKDYYYQDVNAPLSWEPGGYDFFSPCLIEADLMRRVLSKDDFKEWFSLFVPSLLQPENPPIQPVVVSDRSDGHIVHLDGLNFSRAWCLYAIADQHPEWNHFNDWAETHLSFSLPHIVDGDYMGEHWLATFALYTLNCRKEMLL